MEKFSNCLECYIKESKKLIFLNSVPKRCFEKTENSRFYYVKSFKFLPVNVELVNILTIFELTGGKFSNEPAKI